MRMKEAAYYISNPDGTVVCTLCPHRCKIERWYVCSARTDAR